MMFACIPMSLGGTAELAGTSNTTTVSVVQNGPLTPGVTYDF